MNAVRDGNHIRIYNAYMIRESIKEIDGRFYDADDKAWLVPYSKENAALLSLLGVTLGADLMDHTEQPRLISTRFERITSHFACSGSEAPHDRILRRMR